MNREECYSLQSAQKKVEEFRKIQPAGKVGIICGGFDLLHCGHATFVSKAKEQCDFLVVAVTPDSVMKRIKRGAVNPEMDRVELMSALKWVDAAIVGDVQLDYLKQLKPDIAFLGKDYDHGKTYPHVGEVRLIKHDRTQRTSALIRRIQQDTSRQHGNDIF